MSGRILSRGSVTPEELGNLIKKWFKRSTIVVVAECEITYVGRASSRASNSWRLILIKEDGTVLIHEPTGREPINWQPNSYVTAELRGDTLVVRAIRTRPREELTISLKGPCEVIVAKLGVGRYVISGTERDVIEYLARSPGLIEEGAELVSREVMTPHGRVDLVLRDRGGGLLVVEVKRGAADIEAVYQLKRYVEYYASLGVVNVRGVLVAQSLTPNAQKLARDLGFTYRCVRVNGSEAVAE
ncbi:MAG: endonuclease NucS [Zestosphaera sp.]